ncbi:general secretion pathway protein GspD [Sediminicola sp. YIK13]|uniref:type II secretion system protein GspD n=1 Tax=Sediminicola sp. YIK13 TaxID=1453352 RepID=UPI0007204A3A|nr:general secretion pathway protein GspD [Sediminicola sp. YIK13]ALM08798.1 general secretion pathway protein GspD [Sediminicola sp. YIK13]
MKKYLVLLCFLLTLVASGQENQRIANIKNNLELLAVDNAGLTESLKLDINVTNVTLSNFLIAVSRVHQVNINVDPGLQNITIVNNFSNVTVADLLVFLCKQYDLDIKFTGNILSIVQYNPPKAEPKEKEILINFDPLNNLISMDLKNDPLESVFRKVMDISDRNLLYNSGMENTALTLYLNKVPFDTAMEKLAETNGLTYSKSRDGFYLFNSNYQLNNNPEGTPQNRPQRIPKGNSIFYQVLDTTRRMLNVDFENAPIAEVINNLSFDLKLDYYVATPLEEAGTISFKATQIYYDTLLERMFEGQTKGSDMINGPDPTNNFNQNRVPNQNVGQGNLIAEMGNSNFSFKKENDIYFFGTTDQLSVRKLEVVQMMHRSIELLGDPTPYRGGNRSAGRTVSGNVNYLGGGGGQDGFQNNQGFSNNQGVNNSRRISTQSNAFESYENNAEALVNILPDDVKADLDIKIDYELNSFLVSGPSANINRFKKFIKEIDKPVPVILIEVMLIEVKKSASVETGISWGLGDEPTTTKGDLFPTTDLTLGAKTVNKVIGGFDGFGSFNVGKVVPNFFATIKALEENGNLKIRSTPKLSTLNGHRANLSIGETTYYVVTSQNFFGSQIPTSSEIRNYQPIDAELAISIKPLVSGNGQVTLDINVIQSDFSGTRIENDAPPGLTSREFSSIIRMQDQDLAVLGGLEEKVKNDSGSGVPLLARIPIIKWLFSKRKREDSKQKLTILIKPTVIY